MLHEKVASVRRDLVAPASENDDDRQRAAGIGEKVDSLFVKLYGDPSEAEADAAALRILSSEAKAIEVKLKEK